ncbi:MAG: TlpA family protein disulfide reductase [Pseudobacter sp.]|uniref:TlpA family protein disulfide reductase n=1 Tax=Pseudobacter sp. TaxID=2045420 RepID=UPI003F7F4F01
MKKIVSKCTAVLILLVAVTSFCNAQDQPKPTLYVGDKAPEFRYGSVIKGSPAADYKPGHLYLFEFWATWCGPCIASMPHLSEFAKANQKDVSVIAVNVWEDKTGKLSYDSLQPKVEKFVRNMGKIMDFDVVTDTKEEHMGKNWLTAAGVNGIPCTIMVQDGVIQWMGHPVQLDSIVKLVLDGKYDIKKARDMAVAKANRVPSKEELIYSKASRESKSAVEEKRYGTAVKIIDSAIAAMMPGYLGPLNFDKFMILLDHVSEKEAMAFVKEWQKTKPGYKASVGVVICRKPGLKKDSYLYAINSLREMIDNPQPGAMIYKEIATGYSNMGDFKKAMESQTKAIEIARQNLKEGKYPGFIREDLVKEYEATLEEYKKKVKK